MQFKLKKIRSDASFREFFRLYKGKKPQLLLQLKKKDLKILLPILQ